MPRQMAKPYILCKNLPLHQPAAGMLMKRFSDGCLISGACLHPREGGGFIKLLYQCLWLIFLSFETCVCSYPVPPVRSCWFFNSHFDSAGLHPRGQPDESRQSCLTEYRRQQQSDCSGHRVSCTAGDQVVQVG